jgi:LAO/AO transport system kinase
MTDQDEAWAARVFAGDRRAISMAISAVENRQPSGRQLLKVLFPRAGEAFVIGVTGSPGAGKSTLVERLAAEYRRNGSRVGIIAVDPTSPFSGGAILGDRIRMQTLAGDEGVFIRSMATRGQLGGLAPATHDVVTILEAAGCKVVLIETVGVGQDEVDVAQLADVTVLLLVPGMGDSVQTFKAGVMETADIFVINKADHPGADRLEREIQTMLSVAPREPSWTPPIVRTVATTGEGVRSVTEALELFRRSSERNRFHERREKWRARLLELLRQELFERAVANAVSQEAMERYLNEVVERRRDPYSIVEEMIGTVLRHDSRVNSHCD